ncbi:MAG: nuclease-related domain-containing protein [Thermoplasmata archaeon]
MEIIVLTDNIKEQLLKSKQNMKNSFIIILITLGGSLLFFLTPIYYLGYFGILIVIWQLNEIFKNSKIINIYNYGKEGEKYIKQLLKNNLSDEYIGFFGVPVKNGDIDCLVIGPTGAYAIEVKNHRGHIEYDEDGWRQIKVGLGGTTYEGTLKNPEKQILTSIHYLKDFLKQKNMDIYIRGVIVFTNPESNVFIKKQPANFDICSIDTLVEHIKNGKGKLSQEKINMIKNILISFKRGGEND